jgi:hypothetical protein
MRRRAAHYKGLAAGAKRMQDMGHTTASGGGGGKPPKKKSSKGCALVLLAGLGATLAGALALANAVSWLVG